MGSNKQKRKYYRFDGEHSRTSDSVLVKWIEQKAIVSGDKKVKSLAFAIQQVIWAEGSPTDGSSRSGRRRPKKTNKQHPRV